MGPALYLLACVAQDPIEWKPAVDGSLETTLERTFELDCDAILIEHEGETRELHEWLGGSAWHLRARGEHHATWRDTWRGVDAGRPTRFERVFDRLGGRYSVGFGLEDLLEDEDQDIVLSSPVVEHALSAARGDDGWTLSFDDVRAPADEWLEELAIEPAFARWLPSEPDADGLRHLDEAAARAWLRPLGAPRYEPDLSEESEHAEIVFLFAWTVDPALHASLEEARFTSERSRDGRGLDFQLSFAEDVDLLDRLREQGELHGLEEDELDLVDDATLHLEGEGEGTLVWSFEEGRPLEAALELEVVAELELTIADFVARLTFEGTVTQTMSWARD